MYKRQDLDIPSDGRVSLNEIFNRYERTSAYYTNCLGFIPQVGFTYESTNTPNILKKWEKTMEETAILEAIESSSTLDEAAKKLKKKIVKA